MKISHDLNPVFVISAIWLATPGLLSSQSALRIESAVELAYQSEPGVYFQLQETESLDNPMWMDLEAATLGDGNSKTWLLPAGASSEFYRVREPSNAWVLVWSDEFDGDTLDTSKWSRQDNHDGGGNDEDQYYSPSDKYSYVENGALNIAVHREGSTSVMGVYRPYTSARLRTLNRASWKCGRFEIRARVPGEQGMWPAIWMLPVSDAYGTWAASGEIDIMESRGNQTDRTLAALHFGGQWPDNDYRSAEHLIPGGGRTDDGYYTYAVEWTEDEIRWYFDETLWYTVTKDQWYSLADPGSDTAPFDREFYLILNVAVNGGFFNGTTQDADNVPQSAFPQLMKVDYVRVYKWAD